MDRWVDPIMQEVPTRMPSGLKSLGVGFGAGGLPLLNIAQISSQSDIFITFCKLHFISKPLVSTGTSSLYP